MPEPTLDTETIRVTIRDRSREAPWGTGGPLSPYTREVTISAFCPVDGERRGEPRGSNECEDGAYYWVQQWTNPCGHVDYYQDVAREADRLIELRQDAYLQTLNPGDAVRAKFRANFQDYDLQGRVVEVNLDKREVHAVNADDPDDKGWLPVRYLVIPEAGR